MPTVQVVEKHLSKALLTCDAGTRDLFALYLEPGEFYSIR